MKNNQSLKSAPKTSFKAGFTMIELLLYTSLASLLLLAISIFISLTLESRIKNQTMADVEEQGSQAMQIISQTIRNSAGINSPNQGISSPTLSLNVPDVSKSPTIFDQSSGILRIKEGNLAPVSLISSRITISNLTFQNLTRTGTKDIIRIQMTISYVNNNSRNEYDYHKTFYTSASLR